MKNLTWDWQTEIVLGKLHLLQSGVEEEKTCTVTKVQSILDEYLMESKPGVQGQELQGGAGWVGL